MKRLFYILIIAGAGLVNGSCNDWLEATSETQIEANDLLTSEEGFRDALTGVYINMGSTGLYGKNCTWYGNDLAAFPYKEQVSVSYAIWQKHQYKNATANRLFEEIWESGYNVIANVNKILSALEERQRTLDPLFYRLVKGELLGIRAYVHFDLLRMFGLARWTENGEKYTVPYVREFTKEQTPQRTYAETAALLLADIQAALENLGDDPIKREHDLSWYDEINNEGFWNDRGKRMNYYAVMALAARVYMWEGSGESLKTAADYAQKVIDRAPVSWVNLEAFNSTVNDDSRDWSFSSEHLFSLEVYGMSDNTSGWLMVTNNPTDGIKIESDVVTGILFIPFEEKIIQEEGWWYDENNPTGGPDGDGWFWREEIKETIVLPSANDVRYNALLTLSDAGTNYVCKKLYQSSGYYNDYRNRVPMIKLSEMYYLLAEYYLRQNNAAKALEMLDIVRGHRGIKEKYEMEGTDPVAELTLEYMREFIGEGQLGYYWKRTGAVCPVERFPVMPEDFLYPYPTSEVTVGGRHQDV